LAVEIHRGEPMQTAWSGSSAHGTWRRLLPSEEAKWRRHMDL